MTSHNRRLRTRPAGALAAALLVAGSSDSGRLVDAPEPGTPVSKHFTLKSSGELENFSLVFDGFEFEFLRDLGSSFETVVDYFVTDQVLVPGPGRPLRLRRSFDDLTASVTTRSWLFGEDAGELGLFSELDRSAVCFDWDPEREVYLADYEPTSKGLRPALLEGLDEDMSLRCLLPPDAGERAPAKGESWELPIRQLLKVGMPGGDLALLPKERFADDVGTLERLRSTVFGAVRSNFPDWVSGTATATYAGAVSAGEDALERITLQIDLELDAELRPLLREWVAGSREEPDDTLGATAVTVDEAQLAVELSGQGELLWDRVAHHVGGLDLYGDYEAELSLDLRYEDRAGGVHTIALAFELRGTWSSEVVLD